MGLQSGRKGKSGAYSTGADIPGGVRGPRPRPAGAGARLAPAHQAQEHLHGRADRAHRPRNPARAHDLYHDRREHRAALLQRPQPAEHPDPHRGGPPHPPRLRRRSGSCAAVRRLFADRASHPRPRRRRRLAQGGLPRGDRHPRADREPGVRLSARGHGPDGPPLGQGDHFGIIYGISPFGLARQIGVPQAEAKGYIEAYFGAIPASRTIWSAQKRQPTRKAS